MLALLRDFKLDFRNSMEVQDLTLSDRLFGLVVRSSAHLEGPGSISRRGDLLVLLNSESEVPQLF